MPEIRRVLETSLYVDDLARSRSFYTDILGLPSIGESDRFVAFDAGDGTVLLVFRRGASAAALDVRGQRIPPHDGSGPAHLAFAVDTGELDPWRLRLRAHGVEIESEVRWPRGGTSVYFRDPDGHCLELAAPGVWPTY
ncbi:MAG: VOC family protein [Gemmatimonadales bacterium]|nr:MAG: VOC family protein [Gemmatimonadales bacterium]